MFEWFEEFFGDLFLYLDSVEVEELIEIWMIVDLKDLVKDLKIYFLLFVIIFVMIILLVLFVILLDFIIGF